MTKVFRILCGSLTLLFWAAVIILGVKLSAAPDKTDAFYLNIKVGCEDISAITCEYSLNGEPQGGKNIGNAKLNTPIPVMESVHFKFMPEEFEFPERLSDGEFSVSFFVADTNGNEFPAGSWSGSADFSEGYSFMLYRENGGFRVERNDT